MRNLFKLALLAALFVALTVTPALAKKKAPMDRTIVDGVTLAEVKPGSQLQPYYPATARASNLYAEVVVSLQVMEDGKVGDVGVLSTSVPDMGFEQSAADAVKRWRFHPALRDGQPIETATLVRLSFAPPTLRAPEGFVFVETSPRNYSVAFMNVNTDRTWTKAFKNAPLSVEARSKIQPYDMPPCKATDRNECIYDKNEMIQFSGDSRVILTNTPSSSGGSTTQPPVRRDRGGRR